MQIVIDIPEEHHRHVLVESSREDIMNAITNGCPLPRRRYGSDRESITINLNFINSQRIAYIKNKAFPGNYNAKGGLPVARSVK